MIHRGLNRRANRGNLAGENNKALAAQAAGNADLHQADVRRLGGIVPRLNGSQSRHGLDHADGGDVSYLRRAHDRLRDGSVHVVDGVVPDQIDARCLAAALHGALHSAYRAADDNDIFTRTGGGRGQQLHIGGLQHRIGGFNADGDAFQFQ